MPNPGTREAHVGVSRVVVIPEAMGVAIAPSFLPREWKERPDDVLAPLRDAGEAMQPAATGEVEENGFDEVAAGVGGGDQVASKPEGRILQETVARVPPCLLEADLHILRHPRHVGPAAYEGN